MSPVSRRVPGPEPGGQRDREEGMAVVRCPDAPGATSSPGGVGRAVTSGSATLRVIVGLDNGGTSNNATVMDRTGRFLVDGLLESPSHVTRGPAVAIESLSDVVDAVLQHTGVAPSRVEAIGLSTPGPASATGVISSLGSTNFARSRLALIRLPWRPRTPPWDPGHVHQRRQRCGPLRAHDVLRTGDEIGSLRSRRSWARASVAASWRPAAWSSARRGQPPSWATSGCSSMGSWSRGNRTRGATAERRVTWKASPR